MQYYFYIYQMNNPLPNRQSIRLRGYDYSSEGLYFVTICCQDKACKFGKIIDTHVGVGFYPTRKPQQSDQEKSHHPFIELSPLGIVIYEEWTNLVDRYPDITLHEFIIMPNHFHAIVQIEKRAEQSPAPTLGNIIGTFKSITTKRCNMLDNSPGRRLWQRNYYEHIIRNTESYLSIARYINENPSHWTEDNYYTSI